MLFLMKTEKNRTARWQQNIDLPEVVQLPSIFDRLSAYVLVGFGRFLPSDCQSKKVSMFQWPTHCLTHSLASPLPGGAISERILRPGTPRLRRKCAETLCRFLTNQGGYAAPDYGHPDTVEPRHL